MSLDANAALVERLEASRAALLDALTERTEQDFSRTLGGDHGEETLGHALAALAQAERSDLAVARGEAPPQREVPEKPLPPQVTHDLAGARHQTLVGLADLEPDAAETLVASISARESALANQINAILESPAAETSAKRPIEFPVIE